jgi:hypothetical protein
MTDLALEQQAEPFEMRELGVFVGSVKFVAERSPSFRRSSAVFPS